MFTSGKSLLENADIEEEDLFPVQGAVTHFKVLFTDDRCRHAWDHFTSLPIAEQEALLEGLSTPRTCDVPRGASSSHERYKLVNHAAKSILRRSEHCRARVVAMEHEVTEQLLQSPETVLVYSFAQMFVRDDALSVKMMMMMFLQVRVAAAAGCVRVHGPQVLLFALVHCVLLH